MVDIKQNVRFKSENKNCSYQISVKSGSVCILESGIYLGEGAYFFY